MTTFSTPKNRKKVVIRKRRSIEDDFRLDTIADECASVVSIYSNDKTLKNELTRLFYNTLNIDFNLWSWVRSLAADGKFSLHLEIDRKLGVIAVTPYYGSGKGLECFELAQFVLDIDPKQLLARVDDGIFTPRFYRYIGRMQSKIIEQFTIIAVIHLFLVGYRGKKLENFTLDMG